MNCRHCKYRLNPNASFCPKCGKTTINKSKDNFIKDNILNIIIGILVVVAISLVISIINVKKENPKEQVNNTTNSSEEVKQEENTTTENNDSTTTAVKPKKHPLNDESILAMENLIKDLIRDYAYSVNIGNPSYLNKYLVQNGEQYKSFHKMIPDFYSKGITLEVISVEITNIERYDEDTFRANIVTEYEIANSDGLRYQKETIDYLINSQGNGMYLVDKSENYNMIDKYTIESYGY